MRPEDIQIDPTLSPAHDLEFLRRLEAVLKGSEPVFFAAVPTSLCLPFDPDYRPDLHPVGVAAIAEAATNACSGHHQKLVTYQRGYWFVIADDYIPYFAALHGLPDYLPCFILGQPDHPLLKDIQGPIDRDSFRDYVGL